MDINLTDRAKTELERLLAKKESSGKPVRIYVAGVGWGGPSFALALDEPSNGDMVQEVKGIKFIFDEDLGTRYPMITIDYKDGIVFKGLRIFAQGAYSC